MFDLSLNSVDGAFEVKEKVQTSKKVDIENRNNCPEPVKRKISQETKSSDSDGNTESENIENEKRQVQMLNETIRFQSIGRKAEFIKKNESEFIGNQRQRNEIETEQSVKELDKDLETGMNQKQEDISIKEEEAVVVAKNDEESQRAEEINELEKQKQSLKNSLEDTIDAREELRQQLKESIEDTNSKAKETRDLQEKIREDADVEEVLPDVSEHNENSTEVISPQKQFDLVSKYIFDPVELGTYIEVLS